jgi:drug/metabolite transporter (DMT)-like permease
MTRKGWLLFALMGVVWGLPYLFIKVSVESVTPATLVFLRTAAASVILLPIALARGEVKPLVRYWKPLLAYTAVEIALPWFLLSNAELRLPSSLTGLLVAAVPLVGALIAFGRHDEARSSRGQYGGMLLGFGGVAALVGLDLGAASAGSYAEMAGVVVSYALGPFIVARYLDDAPRIGVIAVSVAAVSIGYAPAGIVQLPSHLPPDRVIASILSLAVFCTAIAFVAFFALIAEIGPVRATVITYVNPAIAVLLGVTAAHETLTVGTMVGFVLILSGSFLATRAGRSRRSRRAGAPERAPAGAAAPCAPVPAAGLAAERFS